MLNTYNTDQRVNVNAVSGTIAKTCEKSFFKYAQIGSVMFGQLTDDEPYLKFDNYKKTPIVVLQAMCIGDNYMMFEVITKKDFYELKE